MEEDICSRRNFLRKFALASTGALIAGCKGAPSPEPKAVYGPRPVAEVDHSKIGWYYVDPAPGGKPVPLKDKKDVPVDAQFRIDLGNSADSIKDLKTDVFLSKEAGGLVDSHKSLAGKLISIVPSKPLSPGAGYLLNLKIGGTFQNRFGQSGYAETTVAVNFRTRPA